MPAFTFSKTGSTVDSSTHLLKKTAASSSPHAGPKASKDVVAATLLHSFLEAHRALDNYK